MPKKALLASHRGMMLARVVVISQPPRMGALIDTSPHPPHPPHPLSWTDMAGGPEVLAVANAMRKSGVRLANARQNIGEEKFAFNAIQAWPHMFVCMFVLGGFGFCLLSTGRAECVDDVDRCHHSLQRSCLPECYCPPSMIASKAQT